MEYLQLLIWVGLTIWIILKFPSIVASSCSKHSGEEACLAMLPPNYKIHEVPTGKDGPLEIFCRMNIVDIYAIREDKMDFELNTYFGMSWSDNRLLLNKSLTYSLCSNYVWVPNIVYEYAQSIQRFGRESIYFNISYGGFVQTSERINFRVPCKMDFSYYPFDVQHCDFYVGQMSTPDYQAVLKWYSDSRNPHRDFHRSIEWFEGVEPLQFYLLRPAVRRETVQFYDGDKYTNLIVRFTLVRRLMGSILNIYLPSTLIVAVSWINFWIRVDAAPARVALSITSLLTLCTQIQQHKSQLPPINYITAMDIWQFVCIVTVFCTLLEYAFAYTSSMNAKSRAARATLRSPKINLLFVGSGEVSTKNGLQRDSGQREDEILTDLRGSRLDRMCQKLFPTLFVLFSLVYGVYFSINKKI